MGIPEHSEEEKTLTILAQILPHMREREIQYILRMKFIKQKHCKRKVSRKECLKLVDRAAVTVISDNQ